MSQLKAPNGKPSNLTPEQWKLVRTPQFKAWFGDWENDPTNASKVVDENGEPLVVYHGTTFDFNVFTIGRTGGIFFTDNENYAQRFVDGDLKRKGEKSKMLKCFLNVRKYLDSNTKDDILIDDFYNKYIEEGATKSSKRERLKYVRNLEDKFQDFYAYLIGFPIIDQNRRNHLLLHKYDGVVKQGYEDTKFYVVFASEQIKLADGSNTTFDGNNPDIRFAEGGKTKRYMKKIKRGGITYGKSHAEGGIPVKNQSTGDMLEVEGGEGIVNKRSMASDKKVKLNGKEMTICEAVSQLNQLEGGVQFSCDDVEDRQFIEAMAQGGELERGVRTEQEHIQVLKDLYAKRITPKQASKRIAKDHLKEDSRYYSKLAKMEGKMAEGGGIGREETQENNFGVSYKLGDKFILNDVMSSKKGIETSITEILPSGLFFKVDKSSNTFSIKTLHSKGSSLTRGQYLIHLSKMAKGGEIFDKETEDLLSDLTKKYAKGGEVVADKTETINMKDFEGYADQYNGRKNKFFKANDEYQLLVNEGMELKNNTTLPQDEKDKLLAELREKAREAKTTLGEKRKDFVDMREVKSPFYAPQLADGGIFTSLPKAVRVPHELKEIVKSKNEFPIDTEYQFYISKSERFPKIISKGISAKFKLVTLKEGLSTRIYFSISSKATYEKDDNGVWENVAKTLQIIPSLKNDISSIAVNKIARGYDVYFYITKPLSYIDIYNITANVVQNLIDYQSFISLQKLFKVEEKTTIPPTIPTHKKEDDWNWRFKTEDELRAELGGDLYASKDGNVFATSMRYLLGKKINETQEAVEAISKINQKIYGGVGTIIQKQLGIEPPTKDSRENWVISKWMITDKPLAGEEVPPTESKKEITHKDAEDELMRWAKEKTEEKNDNSTRKYQLHHLISYILLNQSNARMSDFTQFIAMAKESRKLEQEILRLSSEKIPIDSFVMKLLINRYSESVKDLKSQIMLFVKYESDIAQELGNIHSHIPYLAELDTFDKDYIINIK